MRFDPALRALRSDDAPQREAQEKLLAVREAWCADPAAAGVLSELDAYGAGAALADCRALGAALGELERARRFAASLLDHLLPALRRQPLGFVPFRHVSQKAVASLLLARTGRAMLMLSAREPGRPGLASAAFSDGEQHEIVLTGEGEAQHIDLLSESDGVAQFARTPHSLRPGSRFALDQAREALVVEGVARRLTVLRLIRAAEAPAPSREFALIDGSFRRRASGGIDESRREMMLALLGRMERRDAAPVLAAMARTGSEHLRWQALRECLALDTALGFAALDSIACDAADPLHAQAGALRAQLIETHPSLAMLEAA
jgi:hypothetical protein